MGYITGILFAIIHNGAFQNDFIDFFRIPVEGMGCWMSSEHPFSLTEVERKISIAIVRTFAYNKDRWKHYSRKEMFYMATKSANLYARIEPDVKEKAESILSTLGIPASSAINMFYKQIILQRGLPFEVKIPSARPVDISTLSEAEFNEELEKGYADMQAGRTKNAKKAFADIRKDYGL